MRHHPTIKRSRVRRWAPLAVSAAAVSLVAAGCGGGDDSTGAEATRAAGYVPSNAPLYMEVSTDFDGKQWQQVDALAKTFPSYPDLRKELEEGLASGEVNWDTEVKPLLGGRAAIAALAVPTTAASAQTTAADPAAASDDFIAAVELAEGKEADAEALLAKQAKGAPATVEGLKVYTSEDGDSVAAVTGGVILVAGDETDLKAAVDAQAAGGDSTLAGSERFTEAIGKLPGDTFAQFYMDLGGLVKQGQADNPQLQQLGPLADVADARFAASAAAEPGGVRVKGVIVGAREQQDAEFAPSLTANVPADAVAYVGFANLQGSVAQALQQVQAEGQASISDQLTAAAQQLPALLGVTVDDLKALTAKEHALVVTRGTPMPGGALALQVDDGARAQATLDALRQKAPALLRQFSPGTTLPAWRQVSLEGGVKGWDLPVSATGGVTYGVDGKLAIVGTSPGAVRQVQAPAQTLAQNAEFAAATEDMPDRVTSVVWINAQEGLKLAQASGAYRDNPEGLADARQVKSVVGWTTGGAEPTFEVFAKIG
jgi:hypothetical protein